MISDKSELPNSSPLLGITTTGLPVTGVSLGIDYHLPEWFASTLTGGSIRRLRRLRRFLWRVRKPINGRIEDPLSRWRDILGGQIHGKAQTIHDK